MDDIPVYLFTGFLDSGKTNFINGALEQDFTAGENTLLLSCEEGDEEYISNLPKNVTVINIEDQEEFTLARLKKLEQQYKPKMVLVEYNGMWLLNHLEANLPSNWVLYQIITTVEAPSFELYAKNMGQLMMEKITSADMVIFNRCTPELATALRGRNLRMVNRQADMFLEFVDGSSDDYLTGDEEYFDMSQEVIDIPDNDFGVWYVDVMDHPDRYEGKKVHMKLIVCHSEQFPGICCPGRFVMTCCEDDIQFMGLIAVGEELKNYKNHDWIEVTAEVHVENQTAYKGEGPVLHMLTVEPCEKIKDHVISF